MSPATRGRNSTEKVLLAPLGAGEDGHRGLRAPTRWVRERPHPSSLAHDADASPASVSNCEGVHSSFTRTSTASSRPRLSTWTTKGGVDVKRRRGSAANEKAHRVDDLERAAFNQKAVRLACLELEVLVHNNVGALGALLRRRTEPSRCKKQQRGGSE